VCVFFFFNCQGESNQQDVNIRCMLSSQCCKCCFLFASSLLWLFFLLIYPSVSVSFADFNTNSPSSNPTCKNYQKSGWDASSLFMQKLPKGLLCHLEAFRAGLDLDGDYFIPVLSAVIAVVLY